MSGKRSCGNAGSPGYIHAYHRPRGGVAQSTPTSGASYMAWRALRAPVVFIVTYLCIVKLRHFPIRTHLGGHANPARLSNLTAYLRRFAYWLGRWQGWVGKRERRAGLLTTTSREKEGQKGDHLPGQTGN